MRLGCLATLSMVSLISEDKQTLTIVNTYMHPDLIHTQTQKLLINIFLNVTELFLW